jgi:hypothetical protein
MQRATNGCVEVAFVGGQVAMRNSKDRSGPVLVFTPAEWEAFVSGVRDGEFDLSRAPIGRQQQLTLWSQVKRGISNNLGLLGIPMMIAPINAAAAVTDASMMNLLVIDAFGFLFLIVQTVATLWHERMKSRYRLDEMKLVIQAAKDFGPDTDVVFGEHRVVRSRLIEEQPQAPAQ